MNQNQPRTPDYNVKILDKTTNFKGRIGAAWINKDGTISIVLDPLVNIYNNQNQYIIKLFKKDDKNESTNDNTNQDTPQKENNPL